MPDEPWYQMLDAMIENAKEGHMRYYSHIETDHPLVGETELSTVQASIAKERLKELGWIKERWTNEDQDEREFQLSGDGIKAAHELNLWRKQHLINKNLIFLTGILGLAAILGLFPTTWMFGEWFDKIVVGLAVVALVALLVGISRSVMEMWS